MAQVRKSVHLLVLTFTLLSAVMVASYSYSQAVAVAEISGQVLDFSGSAVPGATVKIIQTDTQMVRTTTSDATGNYVFTNLPVGPYRLEASAKGFKTSAQSGIVLQVGNNVQINPTLQVGAVSETLEVNAQANMVETKDNAVAQVIDQRRIVDLPLNGRQATQLVLLAGGAVSPPTSGNDNVGSKSFYSSVLISVAGAQGNSLNYLLDGGDNNDPFSNVNLPFPFPDALQEFSVETNALPARNGLHPGGVVNVVTKSGTNQLHGTVFEFLRNGAVNARNRFSNIDDPLKRNQFGGTLGGKIIANKLFFFGGYQGTRQATIQPAVKVTVPTAAMLQGDFRAYMANCRGGKQLGTPFVNNQVPAGALDPAYVKLAPYVPVTSDACGQMTLTVPMTGNEDEFIGRIDLVKSAKNNFFGRYFLVDYRNPSVWDPKNILFSTRAGNMQRAQSFTLGETFIPNSNVVNSAHFTFTRRRNNRGSSPSMFGPADLGIANLMTYVPNYLQIKLPTNANGGFLAGCSTCTPAYLNVNTFQIADDIDVMWGRHQLAFGADVYRTQTNTNVGYLENGNFVFSGSQAGSTGDAFADFAIGAMSEFDQSRPQQTALRQTMIGLYAQDTFKLNKRLTINVGLRWEPALYPVDYYNRGAVFSLDKFTANVHSTVYPNAPAGMFYYGDAGVNRQFTQNHLANFSPRFGFVWNPHGDGRDTLRAGIGILYNTTDTWFGQRLASNPPVVNEIDNQSNPGPLSNPWQFYSGGNPFPGVVPAPSTVTFPSKTFWVVLPANLKPTYVTQWNLTYQRQFAGNWMASASYIGNKTTHMWLGYDLNAPAATPGATTATIAARRPLSLINPTQGALIGNLYVVDDGANANYNGMLLSVQHRFGHGFTLLSNYTWSHCISDGDQVGNIRQSYYQDQRNRAADRGNCNFDATHVFNTSFLVQSPIKGNGVLGRILGHWQFAPIISATSGLAINITDGKDNSATGPATTFYPDRPNQVIDNPYMDGYGPASATPNQYINPKAFVMSAPGTFGTLGRDTLRGPGQFHLDAAISRVFSVTERFKLETRFEAFNAINYTNYNAPVTTLNSTSFGKFTSAGDPRILQIAMKVQF